MATETRPRIRLEWQQLDWVLEGLALTALLLLVLLPVVYYPELPDIIPTHFDAMGKADGFGSKSSLWILPGIGLALYLLLTGLNRAPHIFNFPYKITEENAEAQYRLATRLIRGLKAIVMALFAYITRAAIQSAMGAEDGFQPLLVWTIIGSVNVMMVWYWISASRKK